MTGTDPTCPHLNILRLCGLADDLHDKVSLCVLLKVAPRKLQGVEEGVGGGQLHVVARLVPSHPVHNGRQDLVGLRLQTSGIHILE